MIFTHYSNQCECRSCQEKRARDWAKERSAYSTLSQEEKHARGKSNESLIDELITHTLATVGPGDRDAALKQRHAIKQEILRRMNP